MPPPGTAPVSSGEPQTEEVVQKTTTVTSQTTQPVTTQTQTGAAQSYSGIGYPPGGGEPYSGIGYPPSPPAEPTEVVQPQPPTTTQTTKTTTRTKIDQAKATTAAGVQAKPEETEVPPTAPVSQSAIDATKRAGMDILTRLTQRSNKAILQGVQKAKDLSSPYIDTEHILWGLLTDSGIYQLLSDLKVTPKEVQDALEKSFKKGNFKGQPQFSPRVKRVLELALSAARSLGFEFISPEHILLAIVQEGEGVGAQILAKFNINIEVLNKKITGKKEVKEEAQKDASSLEQFCQDLTQQAREGKLDPVVGRSSEIERVIHILSRRTKNNPCLIGDAGVGKTAIVEGLAQRIAKGDAPEPLLNKRILLLDLMSLIAGAGHRGQFEQRLKNLLKEIQAASGQIIVFIDEIQNLVGAGAGEGAMDASNILKPSLARGQLQAIGTTTVTEYRKYIEKDPALERRFQPILVAEPTIDVAIEMLRALRDKYEAFHKVSISDEALEAAVRLSHRYIGNRFLPDKAVDLIDEAASAVRLPAISLPEEIKSLKDKKARAEDERKGAEKMGDVVKMERLEKELKELDKKLEELMSAYEEKKSRTTNVVSPDIIADIVSRWTKIPVSRLTEKESDKLLTLENLLHKRIVDQEAAVAAAAEAVRRGRAGLKRANRPIGSFVFMGPTGVGKTETAKALAEILFGSEEMMVRLDMSEYMEKHEVAKLIGAPPGYVGYEEGGQLTEAVRLHPYSVVLLDEIEKAHPDVFNILIQLLEDGRLTDNKGRTISFKNTIVICTSNIGTGLIQREMLEAAGGAEKVPSLSTFVVSPVGAEMITFKERYWFKTKTSRDWKTGLLEKFFAGHVVVNAEPGKTEQELPRKGIDAHVIMPSGLEIITSGGKFWQRKSQVSKEWKTGSLGELFAENIVTNAALDDPVDQLPTGKVDTIAVNPDEKEIVTLGDRIWLRENPAAKEWIVESLKDYFSEGIVIKPEERKETEKEGKGEEPKTENEELRAKSEKETEIETETDRKGQALETDCQLPIERIDVHFFTLKGEEIVIFGNRFWKRENYESKEWKTGLLSEFFVDQKVVNAEPKKLEQQLPVGQEAKKAEKEEELEEGEKFAEMAEKLMEELRKFFRPELLNRFDEIVVFRPLVRKHMLAIVDLQLKATAKLLEEQNIGLIATPAARRQLTIIGYDPLYGARPLRRIVQRVIENPVSSMIIKGKVESGDLIEVDFDGNEFVFTTKKAPKPKVKEEPAGFKCLDCGFEFDEESETCPKCQSKNIQKVEEKASLWKCFDCGQEFEAKEKQLCPACQSENVEEVEEKEKETETETEGEEGEAPLADEVEAKVEALAEKAPEEARAVGSEVSQPGADESASLAEPSITPIAQYYNQPEEAAQEETVPPQSTPEPPKEENQ